MFKFVYLMIISVILISCSSHKKVIYRMEDKSKPSWATLSKTVWEDGDKIMAVGFAESHPKSNMQVISQIADNNAKSEIVKLIKNKIGANVHNTQIGSVVDNSNYRFFGTEQALENVHKLVVKNRYYELVSIENGTKIPDQKIEFYSLVEISKKDFEEAVKESYAPPAPAVEMKEATTSVQEIFFSSN